MTYRCRIPLLLLTIRWLELFKPNEDFSDNLNDHPEDEDDDMQTLLETDTQPATMRVFNMVRHTDVSGVSGTGVVAQVIEFSNGRAVINWTRPPHATTVYLSLEDLLSVHSHGGSTQLLQVSA